MSYNQKIVDTFEDAFRNAGSMDKNDPEVGVGLVGAPACGDVMQFYIRVREGQIIDACFKTFGCGSAISSSSTLVDKVRGKTLSQASQITNKEIFDELSLPPVKFHCSVLAEDAIKAAIEDWKSKNSGIVPPSKL